MGYEHWTTADGHEIAVFGEHDQRTVDQLERCVRVEDGARGVLCADGHLGYSQPIGGAVAYRDHVSPSGVGYDIGCGNKAVKTNLRLSDVEGDVPRIMDEIVDKISFGMGRKNRDRVDHPVLDDVLHADFVPQRGLAQLARDQLGTVGAGNHYVDLFADESGHVWVGVHFGSRGFGHKTASGFLALAAGKAFDERAGEGEMESPPILFHVDSELGQSYVSAMHLAGRYAYAGRDVVCAKVLEILGAESEYEVHNHHNFAWRERHGGDLFWVVRKGCTPAYPAQEGFVGATMGETSVILEGAVARDLAAPVGETEAAQEAALFSTVHGAGRAMSRTAAAGKQGTVASCSARDCSYWVRWKAYGQARSDRDLQQHERLSLCPDHPDGKMIKRRLRIKAGAIDFDETRADLVSRNIELRGGAADEAPGAYKRLDEVLDAHAGTVEINHRLRPLGVAMAGADVYDPFKD